MEIVLDINIRTKYNAKPLMNYKYADM